MLDKKELNLEDLENVTGGVMTDKERQDIIQIINNIDDVDEAIAYYKDLYEHRNDPDAEVEVLPYLENYLRDKGYVVENGNVTKI